MDQQWLTIIIVILIIGIVFDGIRRMLKARRDSIKMSLRSHKSDTTEDDNDDYESLYGSEFPNGGARVSERQIDVERIRQARSKYNYGQDIPSWSGSEQKGDEVDSTRSAKVEPSVGEPDPLLDEIELTDDSRAEVADQIIDDVLLADSDTQDFSATDFSSADSVDSTVSDEVPTPQVVNEDHSTLVEEELQPFQETLNLDDAVPMLMDSLETPAPIVASKPITDTKPDPAIDSDPKPITTASTETLPPEKSANQKQEQVKPSQAPAGEPNLQEVLVIHVKAPQGHVFRGSDLLEVILENGLRFGEMDIFHCHQGDEGEGPILYSMANMVKPGSFDLHHFESFSTVGLSFFLTLPAETGQNMDAFESMITAAKNMAGHLGGELNDENRSVLTGQTIEHYRERIRDFTRRQQLDKHK